MKQETEWIEIWVDSANNRYLLMLFSYGDDCFEILDPQDKLRAIKTFSSYGDATSWLNEDEYDLVEGRRLIDR